MIQTAELGPSGISSARATTIDRVRLRNVIVALIFASLICLGMLAVRALVSSKLERTGFSYNLLLAWIPLVLSLAICRLLDRSAPAWMLAVLLALWVLFFPNAPYIVTDLVHLKTRPPVPRWFDYIFMMAHAITGLFLAYLSLALLQARIRERWGVWRAWLFVFLMLSAASLGVYVGRFFRWNSWDVLLRPEKPARDLARFFQGDTLQQALLFCSAFLSLLAMVYLVLHALAHLHAPDERETRSPRG